MSDNNLILVGNGTSLLNNKNGTIIDSYNIVVRYNSFKIIGYEPYVGEKTDIWTTCNSYHANNTDNFKKILIHPSGYKTVLDSIKDKNKCEIINKNLIESIPVGWPSSGLITIYYFLFLKKYSNLTITGFDWWKTEKHHYCDTVERGTNHEPLEEYKIIKNFVEDGRVFFL